MDLISTGLRRCRQKKGLSVKRVAELIQETGVRISPKTIYGWENGRSYPDVGTFLLLCMHYEVEDILGEFGFRAPNEGVNIRNLTNAEYEHIEKFRSLDMHGETAVKCLLQLEFDRCTSDSQKKTEPDKGPER